MLDFIYLNGWGPFWVTLFFVVPFAIVFVYVVVKKSKPGVVASKGQSLSAIERVWIGAVVLLFFAFNVLSLGYMPTIQSARAAADGLVTQEVTVRGISWAFEISERTIEAGRPVRFLGTSGDTMHGFAVYDPAGDVRFTMMLMPGLENPTSIVHTFEQPGTYTVRCLEYCGISHHNMRDTLTVVASKSGADHG